MPVDDFLISVHRVWSEANRPSPTVSRCYRKTPAKSSPVELRQYPDVSGFEQRHIPQRSRHCRGRDRGVTAPAARSAASGIPPLSPERTVRQYQQRTGQAFLDTAGSLPL